MALRFTVDTTCVIAMAKTESGNPIDEIAALDQLIELAREGRVELQLTVAYDRDFDRYKTPEGRARQLDWLASAPIVKEHAAGLFVLGVSVLDGPDVIASDEDAARYTTIRSILDPAFDGATLADAPVWRLAKRTSDTDHLIAHCRSGADAFVTLDDATILIHREDLRRCSVAVCWPTEALAMVESS